MHPCTLPHAHARSQEAVPSMTDTTGSGYAQLAHAARAQRAHVDAAPLAGTKHDRAPRTEIVCAYRVATLRRAHQAKCSSHHAQPYVTACVAHQQIPRFSLAVPMRSLWHA